jgi:hypothetical protein
MESPFRFSGSIVRNDPVSGVTFVERKGLVSHVFQLLEAGEYVQIVGPNQSGRTTLAISMLHDLQSEGTIKFYIPVLINCGALPDACSIGFIRTLIRRLREVSKEVLQGDEYAALRSILEQNTPNAMWELHEVIINCGHKLPEGEAFVIMLDELETMPEELIKDVLCFFRGLFTFYSPRRWVAPYRVIIFTTHDVSYWKLKKGSPFNVSNVVHLTAFSQLEFENMLDNQHAGGKIAPLSFSDDAKNIIYHESGGRPCLLQRLCHCIVSNYSQPTHEAIIGKKEAFRAIFKIFEMGDKSLKMITQDIQTNQSSWRVCKELTSGRKVPYESDYPIDELSELGVIENVSHFCEIPVNLYKRQIVKRRFVEEIQPLVKDFTDEELLLLRIHCIQKILLNSEARKAIFAKLEYLGYRKNGSYTEMTVSPEISKIVNEVLSEQKLLLDTEEIETFITYYDYENVPEIDEIIKLLSKCFIVIIFNMR